MGDWRKVSFSKVSKYLGENMTLRKLKKRDDGSFSCPACGNQLRFKDGEAVAVVDGHLDMDNYKPRYICDACKVYYRAVLTTEYYDVFPLDEDAQPSSEPEAAPEPVEKPPGQGPIALPKEPTGNESCPVCGHKFRFVDGGAVRVVDGKLDMENIKPKYECDTCGVYYREVLSSGFYLPYPQQDEDRISVPSPETKPDAPEEEKQEEKAATATAHHNELSAKIKAAEKRMAEIAVLRTHIINYAKTRDTYVAYRKAGYSKKFREEHEEEILLHQAAKNAFDDMGVKKLPKVKELQAEYAQLLEEKKKTYAEYRRSREEMRELLAAKANVDRLLKMEAEHDTEREKDHEQR